MFAWTSHGTELKRFAKLPITRAAIAVLLLIPLLYGAMYVWAFWSPTERMDHLPVALVNEDVGSELGGKPLHAGQDVVDKLTKERPLGWQVVSSQQAADGLKSGKYYFAVTIPANYSDSIASLGSSAPHQAEIFVTYDDTNSFLASMLGHSSMLQIRDAISEATGKQAVDHILVGLGDVANGMAKASDGAFKLRDGLVSAQSGGDRLNLAAVQLTSGAAHLSEGADQLATGTRQTAAQTAPLAEGVSQLSSGSQQLVAALDAMNATMPTLSSSASQLSSGAQTVSVGASQLSTNLQSYVSGVKQTSSGAQQLASGVQQLSQLQNGLALAADPTNGAPALSDGLTRLQQQYRTLSAGASQYASGASQFATGAQTWVDAAQNSTSRLSAGAQQVSTGVEQLHSAAEAAQAALAVGDTATANRFLAMIVAGTDPAATTPNVAIGANRLGTGINELATAVSNTGSLYQGVYSTLPTHPGLLAAAQALQGGAEQFASPSAKAQIDTMASGAHELSASITQMSNAASQAIPALQTGANQLAAAFTNPDPQHGLVAGAQALSTGSSTLSTGASQLATGTVQLVSGTSRLATGVSQIDTGAQKLNGGIDELDHKIPALVDGVKALDDGATDLANATTQLADGTKQLKAQMPTLAHGLSGLKDGADKLATQLSQGTRTVPQDRSELREARANAVATPVRLTSTHLFASQSWGEGFAPFFISLALWVGCLITWLLLRPLQTRALMTNVNGFRIAWGSLNSALMLAVGQVAIMLGVMHFAIGLDPQNTVGTVLFTMLVAFTFMALQQFFQIMFGSAVGKVIVITLLMVQLASCGGTYPIETEPAVLRAINPYLPMSYAVQGLREAITGGIDARFWAAVIVLAAVLVLSLIGSSIAASRKRTWSLDRLHPAISL